MTIMTSMRGNNEIDLKMGPCFFPPPFHYSQATRADTQPTPKWIKRFSQMSQHPIFFKSPRHAMAALRFGSRSVSECARATLAGRGPFESIRRVEPGLPRSITRLQASFLSFDASRRRVVNTFGSVHIPSKNLDLRCSSVPPTQTQGDYLKYSSKAANYLLIRHSIIRPYTV